MGFIEKMSKRPFLTALIVYAVYVSVFILPPLFVTSDPDAHGITGIEGALTQWKVQLGFSLFFIIIITSLGWWKKIGWVRPHPGSLKFLIPPLLFVGFIFTMNWVTTDDPVGFFTEPGRLLQVVGLLVVMLGVGFTEESMYRGILFFGVEKKYSAMTAVFVTALIFGLFHYVNLFGGADLPTTNLQVLHAIAAGILYAALRLRIGAIWVVMIYHGLWDFFTFLGQSINPIETPAEPAAITLSTTLMSFMPALVYGLFVLWCWYVWQGKSGADPN